MAQTVSGLVLACILVYGVYLFSCVLLSRTEGGVFVVDPRTFELLSSKLGQNRDVVERSYEARESPMDT